MSDDGIPHAYTTSTFASAAAGETIASYSWTVGNPRGAVFLLHGFRSHTRFNFLRNDSPTSLHHYGAAYASDNDSHNGDANEGGQVEGGSDTSLVRELNIRQLSVYGHDHVGHGLSTGLRAYFPSFSTLVSDLLAHIRHIGARDGLSARKIPIFLVAHSLGGTVAITAARDNPQLFSGIALSSAATEPPANMFGMVGRIQSALSFITSALIPTIEVVTMPKNTDLRLQAIFEADELNDIIGIRARVGHEMLKAYDDIGATAHKVTTPFLAASGELDTIVNPQAAKRFYDRAMSTDKTYKQAEGRWHNLFTEEGCELVWELFADWVSQRVTLESSTY